MTPKDLGDLSDPIDLGSKPIREKDLQKIQIQTIQIPTEYYSCPFLYLSNIIYKVPRYFYRFCLDTHRYVSFIHHSPYLLGYIYHKPIFSTCNSVYF